MAKTFDYQKPSSSHSHSSTSSSSSLGRAIRRSSVSSPPSPINQLSTRSITPTLSFTDCESRGIDGATPVEIDSVEQPSIGERIDAVRSGDSISVTVRFRPLSEREFQRGDEIVWYADGDDTVRSEYSPATAYAFDTVFGPSTNSQMVYDVAARPVIRSAMEGVNGTVFAYGVTSSGKTHTMHGDQISPGIIPLAIMDVFNIIQDTPGREFLLRVSYLEIYNEVINDLLDPTGQNLRVREDAQGTYVEGIKEEVVLSPGHALSFIAAGEEHRHVGSNNFNLMSSRSHTIFTLMIESSACGDEYDGVIFSQLNLIDLAGSESSKTETTGLRRKEGAYINKSLLTLGTVIGKLSEGKASHVPYRDSKLTRLLQSSLSGRGHVSLICTVTPASSSMEETHNTLKFASRAKRVEIYASCNRIVDEKSLIKKYQREISSLRQELDHLKKGVLGGVSHEEILTLRQKLEEGQVKMRSRLEEEEEEKAALMSRIQRLTKLILVSTKNTIPGLLSDIPIHQHSHSGGEDGKLAVSGEGSPLLLENETQNDLLTSARLVHPESSCDLTHRMSSTNSQSQFDSSVTESTEAGEPINEIDRDSRLPTVLMTMSDQMDLFLEQVKMLAGEIAFDTSTLKRLVEQSKSDPDGTQIQIQNLEFEIQEKRRQMRVLEQHILESRETSVANTSLVDMQQTNMRLMTQCNEKDFELEIKSADNRVLQEQLQNKCSENEELLEKLLFLEQQLSSTLFSDQYSSLEYIDELKKKIQSQEIVNEKLNLEHIQLLEEISGLRVQNQKLAEEASYAKELASAAAVELKNLASEITKLSLQNAKQAKELLAAKEMAHSRGGGTYLESKSNSTKHGRKAQITSRGNENQGSIYDDAKYMNFDPDELKMELQTRKQREAILEAALVEKKLAEDEYKKKMNQAMKREAALENDLANMWVLVAKLKKESGAVQENFYEMPSAVRNLVNDLKTNVDENKDITLEEIQVSNAKKLSNEGPELEPLIARLKARMQEMKEKKLGSVKNGDDDSHVCKVCFEAPTAALLQPCRHYCLCKPCSLACSECPVCRSIITDRIFAFPS